MDMLMVSTLPVITSRRTVKRTLSYGMIGVYVTLYIVWRLLTITQSGTSA